MKTKWIFLLGVLVGMPAIKDMMDPFENKPRGLLQVYSNQPRACHEQKYPTQTISAPPPAPPTAIL